MGIWKALFGKSERQYQGELKNLLEQRDNLLAEIGNKLKELTKKHKPLNKNLNYNLSLDN